MSAAALLRDLAAAGVRVKADAGSLVVAPASKLSDHHRAALRALKPELLALFDAPRAPAPAADKPAPDYGRRCADCRHLTRRRTCLLPEIAGLIPAGDGFGLAWPGPVHASTCRAFDPKDARQAGRIDDGWSVKAGPPLPQPRACAATLPGRQSARVPTYVDESKPHERW